MAGARFIIDTARTLHPSAGQGCGFSTFRVTACLLRRGNLRFYNRPEPAVESGALQRSAMTKSHPSRKPTAPQPALDLLRCYAWKASQETETDGGSVQGSIKKIGKEEPRTPFAATSPAEAGPASATQLTLGTVDWLTLEKALAGIGGRTDAFDQQSRRRGVSGAHRFFREFRRLTDSRMTPSRASRERQISRRKCVCGPSCKGAGCDELPRAGELGVGDLGVGGDLARSFHESQANSSPSIPSPATVLSHTDLSTTTNNVLL